MRSEWTLRRVVRASCGWLGAVLLAGGCANIIGLPDSKQHGACLSDDECAPDYGCIQGSCRSGCGGDEDCETGSRCLKVVDKFGCLPFAEGCGEGCAVGTLCVAGSCRTPCAGDDDCAGGQACQLLADGSGVCVGTDADHDEPVDPNASSMAGASGTPSGCEPRTKTCQDGAVAQCNAEGTAYEHVADCEPDRVCSGGECITMPCQPGLPFCSGSEVRKCADDGLASEVVTKCDDGSYCDEESAECRVGACAPAQPACDGDTATVCDASGSGFEPGGELCGEGTSCASGACKPWICNPDESFCQEESHYRCSSSGLTADAIEHCKGDEFCQESSGTVTCEPQSCEPGSQSCDGNTAKVCNDRGSGFVTTDCGDYDQTCVLGACTGACSPDQVQCGPGNKLQSCSASGQWNQGTACAVDETCVGDACVGECGPSQSRCTASNETQSCDVTGHFSEATPCPVSKTCLVAGGVASCGGECGPTQTSCSQTVPQTCDATGFWQPGAVTKGKCGAVCTPGGPTQCASTKLQTCQSDGSWDAGTVVAGQCGAECAPNALRCSLDVGQACTSAGSWVSNGSTTPCKCYVADRFKTAGTNLTLDTTTGLIWEATLRPAAQWAAASNTCAGVGMRLPSYSEWEKVMIPTASSATCQYGGHTSFDGAGMPTTFQELGISQVGTFGSVQFWTKDPHPSFPGYLVVAKWHYSLPSGASNFRWFPEYWDDLGTFTHVYRCVK